MPRSPGCTRPPPPRRPQRPTTPRHRPPGCLPTGRRSMRLALSCPRRRFPRWRIRAMVPAGHCSTSSIFARVRSRGQLRPFSKAISAPALMIPSAARLRWLMSSSRRRAAAAAPARTTPGSRPLVAMMSPCSSESLGSRDSTGFGGLTISNVKAFPPSRITGLDRVRGAAATHNQQSWRGSGRGIKHRHGFLAEIFLRRACSVSRF